MALDWSSWCPPRYLLDDDTLPLDHYRQFTARVLAYSFADDDWGTAAAVDAMMRAYPNLTRRHILPTEVGPESIGHFGFFRPKSESLWREVVDWLEQAVPVQEASRSEP